MKKREVCGVGALAAGALLVCGPGVIFGGAQTTVPKLLTPQRPATTARGKTTPTDAAKQALARAHYYYNNDDISDEAVKRYRQIITSYPGTPQAENARYYVGAYYQRKYYIRKERGTEDKAALVSAARGYLDYIRNYANASTAQWLSDSYFNLALIALQRGDERRAREHLQSLKTSAAKDKSVYIYQIIWSPKSSAIVDRSAPAQSLANTTIGLLDGNLANQAIQQAGPPRTFNDRVAWLTKWCKSQRS